MPVFSLPTEYGIGDFGKAGYNFIDYLKRTGQKVWQILPLVQTGYGNSPYSSVSAESINPYFISPEELVKAGLCTKEEIEFTRYNGKYIDYGFLYSVRFPMLKKAFSRFDKKDKNFVEFLESKKAYEYALYMSLKYASGQKHFYEWEDKFKYRDKNALETFAKDYKEEILFWQFVQYEGLREWKNLKDYANANGISVMGDMPLYVALDSVDVWQNRLNYKLEEDFTPKKVAGVPPDYFCADGQLWGNPVYDYEYMEKDGFSWWINRIKNALTLYDYVRIDHFRGLDRFYEVPYGAETARVGEWIKAPSDKLFSALHKAVDKKRIIAEDLGIIDDGVRELLAKTGYPGMKILLFAFNGEENNLYLPQNIPQNSVCYTGTHDNDTLKGYIENCSEWDYNNLINGVRKSLSLLNIEGGVDTQDNLRESIIKLGFACKSDLFIMPFQDLKGYSNDYRINEPGTVKAQNWAIKFNEEDFDERSAEKLLTLTKRFRSE